MEFAIRHYIPGRVRVHAPELCHRRTLAEATFAWLRKFPGVTSVRANYDCSSVVIEYERSGEAAAHQLLGRLRSLTIHELRILVGTNQDSETPSAPDEPLEKQFLPPQQAPLILPTVSVALAFSANPLALAVNFPLMLWNGYPIALRAWKVWSPRNGSTSTSSTRSRSQPRSPTAIRWPARWSLG